MWRFIKAFQSKSPLLTSLPQSYNSNPGKPLLSLICSSSTFLHKRACSSTTDLNAKNSGLAEYLIGSLKFSEDRALSVCSSFPRTKSLEKPKEVVHFLKGLGLSDARIQSVAISAPQVLFADVGKNLKPKVIFFEEMGVSGPYLCTLISKNPGILTHSLDRSLKPFIHLMKKVLDGDGRCSSKEQVDDLLQILTRCYTIGQPKHRLEALCWEHPKGAEGGIDFLIEGDKTTRKNKFLLFFLHKKKFFGPIDHLLPAASYTSLNYLIIQYFLLEKQKMPFDPIRILNHFVVKQAREQERRLDQRVRSCVAPFLESLTLSPGSKTSKIFSQYYSKHDFYQRASFAEAKTGALFPFFGATLSYLRDGDRNRPLTSRLGRAQTEPCKRKLRQSWKMLYSQTKDKDMATREQIVKVIGRSKVLETMVAKMVKKIVKRRRKLRRPSNSYLGRVEKMQSICSNRTNTNTFIESVKIRSLYQSAAPIAQEIVRQLKERRSIRTIFNQIVRNRPRWVIGVRLSCAGRLRGAEIARTECYRFGKTSLNVLDQKIDYAFAQAPTKYGILGIKVWLSYDHKGP